MKISCVPIDPAWIAKAAQRQLELTKPPGSLGRLEEIANRCVAIRESFELTAKRPRNSYVASDALKRPNAWLVVPWARVPAIDGGGIDKSLRADILSEWCQISLVPNLLLKNRKDFKIQGCSR